LDNCECLSPYSTLSYRRSLTYKLRLPFPEIYLAPSKLQTNSSLQSSIPPVRKRALPPLYLQVIRQSTMVGNGSEDRGFTRHQSQHQSTITGPAPLTEANLRLCEQQQRRATSVGNAHAWNTVPVCSTMDPATDVQILETNVEQYDIGRCSPAVQSWLREYDDWLSGYAVNNTCSNDIGPQGKKTS